MTADSAEARAEHGSVLGAVLQGLPMQLCLWDADLRLVFANAAAMRNPMVDLQVGRTAAEQLSEPLLAFLLPYFRAAFDGHTEHYQHTVLRPGGQPDLSHIIDIAPVRLDGDVVAVRTIATQVSHSEGAQAAAGLRAERDRVSTVLHTSVAPRLRSVLRELALMPRTAERRDVDRLSAVVTAIDDSVVELRTTIGQLRNPGTTHAPQSDHAGWSDDGWSGMGGPAVEQAVFDALTPVGVFGPGITGVAINAAARALVEFPADGDVTGRTLRSVAGHHNADTFEVAIQAALGGAEVSGRIEYTELDGTQGLGLWRSGPAVHADGPLAVVAMVRSDGLLAEVDPESQVAGELAGDRRRLAEDLHDHVIQLLYAGGLALEGVIDNPDDEAADGLANAVGCVTEAIVVLDSVLDSLGRERTEDVEGRLRRIVRRATASSRLVSRVDVSGDASRLPPDVVADLSAVLREALSNATRHAHARRVHVVLSVEPDLVRLLVIDDGVGIGTPQRSSGLTNMRARAERRGGTFEVRGNEPSGTAVDWSVPL